MAKKSYLLTVSVLVEQDEEATRQDGLRTQDAIRHAVTAAVAALYAGRSDTTVEYQSLSSTPLDGKPAVGRCAVCDRWMYDEQNATERTPTGVLRGAVVDGRYRCGFHLPHGHPLCFGGHGYDGPVPAAGAGSEEESRGSD
jgi:hypothetical protein